MESPPTEVDQNVTLSSTLFVSVTDTIDVSTTEESSAMETTMNTTFETTSMSSSPDNLAAIIGGSVGGAVALILLIILITYCVMKVKKKRAFEGKYSPSANEQKGGVQMNDIMNVMQPPPPERLI